MGKKKSCLCGVCKSCIPLFVCVMCAGCVTSRVVVLEFHAGVTPKFMPQTHGPGFKVTFQQNTCPPQVSDKINHVINANILEYFQFHMIIRLV